MDNYKYILGSIGGSGDRVRIASAYGEMIAFARISEGVPKGSIATPAMFPKVGQAISYLFAPTPTSKLGDVDTMVAVNVSSLK